MTEKENDHDVILKLSERVARTEEAIEWMKHKLETIDRRTWQILGSVVAFGVLSIIIALIGLLPK